MNYVMLLVNIFLPPLLTLKLFCKNKKMPLAPNFQILCDYLLFTLFCIPVTHVFVALARKFSMLVTLDSAMYTLFAIISALLVYFFYRIFSAYFSLKLNLRLSKGENDEKQE